MTRRKRLVFALAAVALVSLYAQAQLTGYVRWATAQKQDWRGAAAFIQSHYRSGRHADELRPSAPRYHTGPPDLDKLQRAIGDALTATVIRDDRQIAVWQTQKLYGKTSGARIDVVPLPLVRTYDRETVA